MKTDKTKLAQVARDAALCTLDLMSDALRIFPDISRGDCLQRGKNGKKEKRTRRVHGVKLHSGVLAGIKA